MFTPRLVRVVEVEGDPEKWSLTEDLRYDRAPRGRRTEPEAYLVRAPFRTDFASIPSAFAWAVPRYGAHTKAAIVHDRLCVSEIDRFAGDEVFRDALAESGVSWGRRWLLWTGVTWGSVHAALRAVVKGRRDDPVPLDRLPDATESPVVDAGVASTKQHDPAGAWRARIRGAIAALILLAACPVYLDATSSPGDGSSRAWWQWALAMAGLAALVLAGVLVITAVALWRLDLIGGGKFPAAWLLSVGVLPFVPIALGAAVLMFVYTLAKPLRRRLGRRRANTTAQDPGFQRLERARANFIR